jgi:hypothetical protein
MVGAAIDQDECWWNSSARFASTHGLMVINKSEKHKAFWNEHAIVPDTPDDLTSSSKIFLMLTEPPGAK